MNFNWLFKTKQKKYNKSILFSKFLTDRGMIYKNFTNWYNFRCYIFSQNYIVYLRHNRSSRKFTAVLTETWLWNHQTEKLSVEAILNIDKVLGRRPLGDNNRWFTSESRHMRRILQFALILRSTAVYIAISRWMINRRLRACISKTFDDSSTSTTKA